MSSPLGKLDSITLQVEHNLLESSLICTDKMVLISKPLKFKSHLNIVEIRLRLLDGHDLLDTLLDVDCTAVFAKFIRVNLGKGQNVLNIEVEHLD